MNDRILPRPVAASPRPGQLVRAARRGLVPLAVALGLSAPLAGIQAAEWTLAPDLRIGGHYNDNVRLRETNEIDVQGGFVDLGALAQWRTPTASFQLRPRLHSTFYPDNSDEESNDAYLDFAARNATERAAWALVGNYAREQVIRGERTRLDFVDPELELPEEDATGRIDERRRRTRWRVAPSFSHEVTERTDAGVVLSYSDVSYSPQQVGEALDYNTARADAFLAYQLTPTSRFRTTIFASTFEADAIGNDSTSYGLRGRYERDITEVYNVYVDVGVRRTEVEAGLANEVDDTSTGALFDAGIRRQWERTTLQVAGGRSVQPSGTGFLRENDQIRINLRHQFLPRWYGELAGIAQTTDSVDSDTEFNARDYYQVRARLGHELTRDWTVEATYSFARQDYEDTPGTAEANEVFLSLNYQPRGRVWSW